MTMASRLLYVHLCDERVLPIANACTRCDQQEEKIKALTEAAGVSVEPYWPGLFAKVVEKVNMEDLIANIGSAPAPGAAAPASGGAAPAEEAAAEEEEESEEEEEMDFDLFD